MKLATIEREPGHAHVAGVTADNDVLDMVALRGTLDAAADVPADMRGLLAGGQSVLDRVGTCLDAVAASHDKLPRPEQAGRVISIAR